ncbi:uncharacterized protein H6S33_009893 [Morchella sextelata]|uniref:uncharacterized protein n=1 Tax=Morchella sextelata TaxID=1174677 RepID=UPI001D04BA4E|nr:uncharacterized protein H6S33_009893 [Morchella sextelata]KAH0602225.1 hypothetical protein H6S33_009893 [Morchella sextelata]
MPAHHELFPQRSVSGQRGCARPRAFYPERSPLSSKPSFSASISLILEVWHHTYTASTPFSIPSLWFASSSPCVLDDGFSLKRMVWGHFKLTSYWSDSSGANVCLGWLLWNVNQPAWLHLCREDEIRDQSIAMSFAAQESTRTLNRQHQHFSKQSNQRHISPKTGPTTNSTHRSHHICTHFLTAASTIQRPHKPPRKHLHLLHLAHTHLHHAPLPLGATHRLLPITPRSHTTSPPPPPHPPPAPSTSPASIIRPPSGKIAYPQNTTHNIHPHPVARGTDTALASGRSRGRVLARGIYRHRGAGGERGEAAEEEEVAVLPAGVLLRWWRARRAVKIAPVDVERRLLLSWPISPTPALAIMVLRWPEGERARAERKKGALGGVGDDVDVEEVQAVEQADRGIPERCEPTQHTLADTAGAAGITMVLPWTVLSSYGLLRSMGVCEYRASVGREAEGNPTPNTPNCSNVDGLQSCPQGPSPSPSPAPPADRPPALLPATATPAAPASPTSSAATPRRKPRPSPASRSTTPATTRASSPTRRANTCSASPSSPPASSSSATPQSSPQLSSAFAGAMLYVESTHPTPPALPPHRPPRDHTSPACSSASRARQWLAVEVLRDTVQRMPAWEGQSAQWRRGYITAMKLLAELLEEEDQYAEAREWYQRILDTPRESDDAEWADLKVAAALRASSIAAFMPEALEIFTRVLAARRRVPPPADPADSKAAEAVSDPCAEAVTMAYIGEVMFSMGDRQQGVAWSKEAYDRSEPLAQLRGKCKECALVAAKNIAAMIELMEEGQKEQKEKKSRWSLFSGASGAEEKENLEEWENRVLRLESIRATKGA